LSGRLAIVPHPSGAGHDYNWGRGGMHQAWGLGVPILATPFYLVARLFGAPGFPDSIRFLVLYALTTVVLARVLHKVSRSDPNGLVAGALAAGGVMVFPTFVGLVSSRFRIYEQTIATSALWSVLLLAGTLALSYRCTVSRLVAVCAAAGFSLMMRPPTAAYGVTTLVLALVVARRKGLRLKALFAAFGAYVGVSALWFVGNALRFGSPFEAGYFNCQSGTLINRHLRWGPPFIRTPITVAAKELYETFFNLEPVPSQIMEPPEALRPYTVGERWREYYAPTYDKIVLCLWCATFAIVVWRVVRGRLWRRDRPLEGEVFTLVGLWALPPSIALFAFYTVSWTLVTRYATDLYPAFAACALCVGMAIVQGVRWRWPDRVPSARLAIAGAVAIYIAGWRGWATDMSRPVDRKVVVAEIAQIDAMSQLVPAVPDRFACHGTRGPQPLYGGLADWHGDCSFESGMLFTMPHRTCVAFRLLPRAGTWDAPATEALSAFRATADFDRLVRCGDTGVEGIARIVTMCDPHRPAFLLDGLRAYAIASLDDGRKPISDRLLLDQINGVSSCSAPATQ
jgi:hypothetical protein